MGTPHSPDRAGNADAVSQALGDLERYAGWLAKGFTQTRVRDGVQALGAAIATEGDVSSRPCRSWRRTSKDWARGVSRGSCVVRCGASAWISRGDR